MDFAGNATALGADDINNEAATLDVEPAAIWAVCDVESAGSGFLDDKRPKILFEAHSFHTLTYGKYDRSYPNLSSSTWDRSLYGASGAHQYDRMEVAIGLNRIAALESASWGRFQIMGSNFKVCGFADVETFVTAMMDSELNHLKAFAGFCKSAGIIDDLKTHDWAHFALRYNGPGNVPDYAGKLQSAYMKHAATLAPQPASGTSQTLKSGSSGAAVMALQQLLITAGYKLTPDGDFGPATKAAVISFQNTHNLQADGVAGPATQAALNKLVPKP